MEVLAVLTLLLATPYTFGSPLKITVENITIEYADAKYLSLTAGVYEMNGTVTVNLTLKLKTDLPENFMIYVKAFKWFVDDYRIQIFQIRKPLKDALEMESFDIQNAFLVYTRPPAVWPLQKGVTYRLEGWNPDGTKFPPNIPDGKWKVRISGGVTNKSPILIGYWFGTVH